MKNVRIIIIVLLGIFTISSCETKNVDTVPMEIIDPASTDGDDNPTFEDTLKVSKPLHPDLG